MPAYLLLLRPAPNRVYGKDAGALNTAELSVLDDGALGGALRAIGPAVVAGVEYVRFETGADLTADQVGLLSNLSSAFALFRAGDEGSLESIALRPVALSPVAHLDDDLLTILRYKGKTNEQFTKLLTNVTLAASSHASDWPGRRLRILDPVCGRGTTLNQGLVYGFDVDGIEIDRVAYDAYRTFLVTWLKDKRFKHQVHTMPVRRDGKIAGRRLEVVFARDKDEYKADDVQRVRLVNDDTLHAAEHYRKPVFDAVIADLPYGVQHASRAKPDGRARSRTPEELLAAALPGWTGAMKAGAAIGMSWNTKVMPRANVVELLGAHGLTVRDAPPYSGFEHRVDAAITRDLVVATKPA